MELETDSVIPYKNYSWTEPFSFVYKRIQAFAKLRPRYIQQVLSTPINVGLVPNTETLNLRAVRNRVTETFRLVSVRSGLLVVYF